jgi:putative DNA methylase
MSVRAAITMINQVRGETLSMRQDTFDEETRWAVQWFEEYGFRAGEYGRAEVAFTGTNVALERLRRAGIVASRPPKLWLIPPDELPALWAPRGGSRDSVWELTMHLARRFKYEGQSAAGELLGAANRYGNEARDLTYRLADLCERHERKDEALMFHDLVVAWPEIARAAAASGQSHQDTL